MFTPLPPSGLGLHKHSVTNLQLSMCVMLCVILLFLIGCAFASVVSFVTPAYAEL